MNDLIRKYRNMSFEQKTVFNTVIGLCLSTALACGKFIVGLFTDYDLCGIAIYTFALLLSKLECVLGVKSDKRSFRTRNILVAIFLFVSSALYTGFMLRMLFVERKTKQYGFLYVVLLAFISFVELGFAIAGILRTKNKGHYYRNIKIINFAMALIAILTTQTTILDYCATADADVFNSYTGIGVGLFIAVCAIYILIAPKISLIDRERNVFVLKDAEKNNLIDLNSAAFELTLSKSRVYGSYVYRAKINCGRADGNIERGNSLWKRMHILVKILCCILSEILIFIWLFGRFIFFLRTINLPKRLEKIMVQNGFVKVN